MYRFVGYVVMGFFFLNLICRNERDNVKRKFMFLKCYLRWSLYIYICFLAQVFGLKAAS